MVCPTIQINQEKGMSDNKETNETKEISIDSELEKKLKLNARVHTDPAFALLMTLTNVYGDSDPDILYDEHKKQMDMIASGSTIGIEAVLYTQAATLDALFHQLVGKMTTARHEICTQTYSIWH